MGSAFLLTLREGLEAALIIGIVLGAWRKLGYSHYARYVWWGAGVAVIASLAGGATLVALGAQFEGHAKEIFEGVTMLLAALILTWMIVWMMVRGQHLQAHLEGQVHQSVALAHHWGLLGLAFVAVVREGLELALFLTASAFASTLQQTAIGTLFGIGTAIVLGWGILTATVRLDMRRFFQATSIILVIVAAGLVAHGIHELNEATWIPPLIEHVWDINPFLPEKSIVGEFLKALVGYNGHPSLTEVVGYVAYLAIAWLLVQRQQSIRHAGAASPAR